MQWWNWLQNLNHMTLMATSVTSHDQKVRSWLIPLILMKERCGASGDGVGIIWCWWQCKWHQITRKSCCTSFELPWPKKYSGAIDNSYYQHDLMPGLAQWCHMTKNYVASNFDNLDWRSATVHITWCWHHGCGITWQQDQCQWHNVVLSLMSMVSQGKNVMLHLISIVST